jgi:cyclin T
MSDLICRPKLTIATALVFFHRFYARQSFKKHDRATLAATCLHLAGKVEETPRKLSMVIQVAHHVLHKGRRDPIDPKSQDFAKQKECLLNAERVLLHTVAFELSIEHPYTFLLQMVKKISIDKMLSKELVQTSWNFVNDSYGTNLCLQYPPHDIAAAMVYLSGKYVKLSKAEATSIRDTADWLPQLGLMDSEAKGICWQLMELYQSKKQNAFMHLREEFAPPVQEAAKDAEGAEAGVEHRNKRHKPR